MHRRVRQKYRQIRLRTLLCAVTVVCVALYILMLRASRRSREFQFRGQIYPLKIVGYYVYECTCAGTSSVLVNEGGQGVRERPVVNGKL